MELGISFKRQEFEELLHRTFVSLIESLGLVEGIKVVVDTITSRLVAVIKVVIIITIMEFQLEGKELGQEEQVVGFSSLVIPMLLSLILDNLEAVEFHFLSSLRLLRRHQL